MIVSVTQAHIDNGYRLSTRRDPIALAIREALPDALYVSVVGPEASAPFAGRVGIAMHRRFALPPRAVEFIQRFDAGLPVEPFTLVLGPPDLSTPGCSVVGYQERDRRPGRVA